MTIARNPAVVSNLKQLPPSWTTLYTLARMDPGDLQRAIDAGKVTPQLSGAEAEELRTGKPRAAISGPGRRELEAEVEDLTFQNEKLTGELAEAKRQLDNARMAQDDSSPEATAAVHDPGPAGAPAGTTGTHRLIQALGENGPLNESDFKALLETMEKVLTPEQQAMVQARMEKAGAGPKAPLVDADPK
jgi:hypothetical protein